ncbi:MAG: thymidylate synthase [Bacteroidales bacterium]|nr:thymidylate synthase [Bacteroidales bacterium]
MNNREKARFLARQIKEEIGLSEHSIERVMEIILNTLEEKDQNFKDFLVKKSAEREDESNTNMRAFNTMRAYIITRLCKEFFQNEEQEKKNELLKECLANVNPETRSKVRKNIEDMKFEIPELEEQDPCIHRQSGICMRTESKCGVKLCPTGKEDTYHIPAYNHSAPPLGVKPRFIHEKDRLHDIIMAMQRMAQDSREIYDDWLDELQDLLPRYNAQIRSFKKSDNVLNQIKK